MVRRAISSIDWTSSTSRCRRCARGGDVLLLAQNFIGIHVLRSQKAVRGMAPAAAERLLSYPWPGNIRELHNCIELAVALTTRELIDVEDLPEEGRPLPAASGDDCLVNSDCGEGECTLLECVAGACVPAGPRFDADGDGFAPAPCGPDCDDANASAFPNSNELCNASDDDCDGRIDEDATGSRVTGIADGLADAVLVAAGSRFAVIGASESGLLGYTLEADGSRSTTKLLLGPASQIVARNGKVAVEELQDPGVVADLVARTRALRPSRSTTSMMSSSDVPDWVDEL